MNGVQISAISNIVTDELRGLQYCPIVNIASKTIHSTQLAMGNVCLDYMRGLQIGVWNYAHKVKGFQTGVINVCDSLRKGVQIGLINITHDSLSHVVKGDCEAKFWLEPIIELAYNYGFNNKELKKITQIITIYGDNFKSNLQPTSVNVLMINAQGMMLSVLGRDYFLSYNRVP